MTPSIRALCHKIMYVRTRVKCLHHYLHSMPTVSLTNESLERLPCHIDSTPFPTHLRDCFKSSCETETFRTTQVTCKRSHTRHESQKKVDLLGAGGDGFPTICLHNQSFPKQSIDNDTTNQIVSTRFDHASSLVQRLFFAVISTLHMHPPSSMIAYHVLRSAMARAPDSTTANIRASR